MQRKVRLRRGLGQCMADCDWPRECAHERQEAKDEFMDFLLAGEEDDEHNVQNEHEGEDEDEEDEKHEDVEEEEGEDEDEDIPETAQDDWEEVEGHLLEDELRLAAVQQGDVDDHATSWNTCSPTDGQFTDLPIDPRL